MSGNTVPTLRYMWATLVHKWCVILAGLRTRAPFWRLVIHDWTKFTSAEAPHYGRRFYGRDLDQLAFAQAWNHHHKTHPHHWEYWIPVTAHSLSPVKAGEPLPMPEWAIREMVADWGWSVAVVRRLLASVARGVGMAPEREAEDSPTCRNRARAGKGAGRVFQKAGPRLRCVCRRSRRRKTESLRQHQPSRTLSCIKAFRRDLPSNQQSV